MLDRNITYDGRPMRWWILVVLVACRGRGMHAPGNGSAEHAVAGDAEARIDLPVLSSSVDAITLDDDPIVSISGPAAVPAMKKAPIFAAERTQLAVPLLDALSEHGVVTARFAVQAGRTKRMIAIELPHAVPSTSFDIAHLRIGSARLALNGEEVTRSELPLKAVAFKAFAVTIDPDVTLQRLAEVTSALGGTLHMVPVPRPPVPSVVPGAPCPALAMAFDGKPMTPAVILARGHDNGGIEVVLSSKKLACSDLLKGSRPVSDDEITAEVIVKGDASAVSLEQVVFDNDIRTAGPQLVGDAPGKAGDSVSVCIPAVTLTGRMLHDGHELTMQGLARATYCGKLP